MVKILVVGPAWIGDMVMTQGLFKLIAKRNPYASIDVLAPSWSLPLLNRMPEVRKAIVFPFGHGQLQIRQRYKFAQTIKKDNYQKAYIIPNSFKSGLVPYFANIPQRIGWRGEWRYGLLTEVRHLDQNKFPQMYQRFLGLGLEKDEQLPEKIQQYFPDLQVSPLQVANTLQRYQLTSSPRILGLCPGAEFGEAKRWLPCHFAEVAKAKLEAGWDVWLFGSKNELSTAQMIMDLTQHKCRNLVGETTLEDAIDLLSVASMIVANDSGLMHISAALNRPLIAIYGPTPADLAPPLSHNSRALTLNLPCSPCFKRVCPLKHFDCMTKITPSLVLNTMDEMLL